MPSDYANPIIQADAQAVISAVSGWEQLRDKRLLVTGATGMLGRYCVFTLLKLNDELQLGIQVLALARSQARAQEVFAGLTQRDDLEILIQDVNETLHYGASVYAVLHCASQASPSYFETDPVGTIKANTLGVFSTLEFVREQQARYLFVSTREIYGQPCAGQAWFVEGDWGSVDSLDVRSCYSEGKRAGETIARCYEQQYGLSVKIARLSHTYGPGMSLADTRVQAGFAAAVMAGEDLVLQSAGMLQRTYTYIADATSALFMILLHSGELAYNIAARESLVTIRELAEAFIAARPKKALRLHCNLAEGTPRSGWSPVTGGNLDASKLEALGWKPQFTLAEGIDRTLRYFEYAG